MVTVAESHRRSVPEREAFMFSKDKGRLASNAVRNLPVPPLQATDSCVMLSPYLPFSRRYLYAQHLSAWSILYKTIF